MKREQSGQILSAVFVDYDNIYLSLRRKSEEAAKRFAKDAGSWVREIESGRLITSTNGPAQERTRRIVMNRCYGNPVPRRNAGDNSTDMNSFPFVRHNFLRAGFEIIDCPPLTAQLKNSADIRMVMDVRDYLTHDTYFDEFVILSGDADFTPVLHRLRAHARRTVIFANDFTAQPYTAICDGEVRESDLLNLLLEGRLPGQLPDAAPAVLTTSIQNEDVAREVIGEVVNAVRSAAVPMPLEALADRAIRAIGHDRTIGSNWAGTGGFRDLLMRHLPDDIRLTEQPPYLAFEARRAVETPAPVSRLEAQPTPPVHAAAAAAEAPVALASQPQQTEPRFDRAAFFASLPSASQIAAAQPVVNVPSAHPTPPVQPFEQAAPVQAPTAHAVAAHARAQALQQLQAQQAQMSAQIAAQAQISSVRPAIDIPRTPPSQSNLMPQSADIAAYQAQFQQPMTVASQPAPMQPVAQAPQPVPVMQAQPQRAPAQPRSAEAAQTLQQSIARIHEACQVPPLSPPEYRALFDCMATEITEQGLLGAQTLVNIVARAQAYGMELRRDDVRFTLEVVGEADPWFEQGASANLLAGRFRNYVVARCRGQGLILTPEELDLIDAWFAGVGQTQMQPRVQQPQHVQQQIAPPAQQQMQAPQARLRQPTIAAPSADRWWNQLPEQGPDYAAAEEFPRIVKNRLRG
jgi:NYN domain